MDSDPTTLAYEVDVTFRLTFDTSTVYGAMFRDTSPESRESIAREAVANRFEMHPPGETPGRRPFVVIEPVRRE